MSGRLSVDLVWREAGGTEWEVTPAHEEQIWGQVGLHVYPGNKIIWSELAQEVEKNQVHL